MKRYAVAVSDMVGEVEVVLVHAESSLDALVQAVINKFEWDMQNEDGYSEVKNVDELITFALQGEVLISNPVQI